MREILFRGKAANRIDGREYRTKYKNGDWVYGLITDVENYAGFSEMTNTDGVSGIEVDKSTVGQFTGLTDKNGNKIFEGDIMRNANNVVEFCNDGFCINGDSPLAFWTNTEIIGNIHDNPELL